MVKNLIKTLVLLKWWGISGWCTHQSINKQTVQLESHLYRIFWHVCIICAGYTANFTNFYPFYPSSRPNPSHLLASSFPPAPILRPPGPAIGSTHLVVLTAPHWSPHHTVVAPPVRHNCSQSHATFCGRIFAVVAGVLLLVTGQAV